jgi:hypothetical protein
MRVSLFELVARTFDGYSMTQFGFISQVRNGAVNHPEIISVQGVAGVVETGNRTPAPKPRNSPPTGTGTRVDATFAHHSAAGFSPAFSRSRHERRGHRPRGGADPSG